MDDFLDTFNSFPLVQKILAFAILAVALFAGFWFALYRPLTNELEAAQNKYDQLETKRKEFKSKLEDQVNKEALQKLRAKILLLEDKLPSSTQLPKLLKNIHNKAKTAGLEILNFERKANRSEDYYVEIPVAMELRGTYGELTDFLNFVRNMSRIVNVENLELKLESDKTGELVASATVTTYRYKQGEKTKEKK